MERTEKLEKALADANEISAMKSSLISMASHEFRTPLTIIMSSTVLIKQLQEKNRLCDTEKHFNKIDTSINRITSILNDFLAIDRVEENKVKLQLIEFNIEELLYDCIEELNILESEGQTVEYSHERESLILHDKPVLHNILSKLISNALKYSEKTVFVHSSVTNDQLYISIKDQGRGIPEDDIETIYEKFHRASNVGTVQGTDLGLNIVKKYADLLNGTISFTSELNVGTEFIISIPLQNN